MSASASASASASSTPSKFHSLSRSDDLEKRTAWMLNLDGDSSDSEADDSDAEEEDQEARKVAEAEREAACRADAESDAALAAEIPVEIEDAPLTEMETPANAAELIQFSPVSPSDSDKAELYENGGVDRLKATEHLEPMLQDDEDRFVLFPIKHHNLWKLCQKAEDSDWRADEVDLAYDADDWNQMTKNEQHFIKMVLGFFAASDGVVMENLAARFLKDIQLPEARQFYAFQIKIESTHSQVYSELIDTYIKDPKEKAKLLGAVKNIPCIREKAAWAKRWMFDERASFARRLVAFAAVEGIQFAGSFAAIHWMKKRGKLPGLTFSNQLISRDEGQHTDFACELYKMLKFKLTQEEVEQVIRGAVATERRFICDAIPCQMIGMDRKRMSQYIEFVADRLMKQLGYAAIYNVQNPFKWMENMGQITRTNFFEKRVAEYEKCGRRVSRGKSSSQHGFSDPDTMSPADLKKYFKALEKELAKVGASMRSGKKSGAVTADTSTESPKTTPSKSKEKFVLSAISKTQTPPSTLSGQKHSLPPLIPVAVKEEETDEMADQISKMECLRVNGKTECRLCSS